MMKKRIAALISFVIASSQSFSEEQRSLWHYHPLHAGGQYIYLGKADCHNEHPSHHHHLGTVGFSKANAFVSMMVPFNRHNIIFPQLQYNYVTFDWNKNTKFNETHFAYMQFDLLYYSTGLEHWKWIMRFDYSLQTKHFSQPGRYSLYNGLLWGAYELDDKWHYHVGALGYAGLESYNIFPIIGLDYAPSKRWLIQTIFPINYSIEYKLSKWTFAAKLRPLKERLRSGSHEPQPRSVFNYSSFGSELNIRYEKQFKLAVDAYGGYNFGGKFYIKDQHGKHPEYVHFDGAIYGGASLDYGF